MLFGGSNLGNIKYGFLPVSFLMFINGFVFLRKYAKMENTLPQRIAKLHQNPNE
jgi:hypothetical protein